MKLADVLIGRRVVAASMDDGTLTLDNGVKLEFEMEGSDCCSYIELADLHTTDNLITAAEFQDNEDVTGGEGEYKAWLHVVTDGGEKRIAEAEGDASNGYYLHGFALDVTVHHPDGSEVKVRHWEQRL